MKIRFFCVAALLALFSTSCFANQLNECGNNVRCIRDKKISDGISASTRRLEERNASRRRDKERRRVEFNKKLLDFGLPPIQE